MGGGRRVFPVVLCYFPAETGLVRIGDRSAQPETNCSKIENGKMSQVSRRLDAGLFGLVRLPGDERENGFLAVLGIRHSPAL